MGNKRIVKRTIRTRNTKIKRFVNDDGKKIKRTTTNRKTRVIKNPVSKSEG